MPVVDQWILEVDRSDIEKGDTSKIVEMLNVFSKDRKTALGMLGRVAIVVRGYDDDLRALWQISEARLWFNLLLTEVPHILFFLQPEARQARLMAYMTCPIVDVGDAKGISRESAARFYEHRCVALNEFCELQGIDPESPALIDLSKRIVECFLS